MKLFLPVFWTLWSLLKQLKSSYFIHHWSLFDWYSVVCCIIEEVLWQRELVPVFYIEGVVWGRLFYPNSSSILDGVICYRWIPFTWRRNISPFGYNFFFTFFWNIQTLILRLWSSFLVFLIAGMIFIFTRSYCVFVQFIFAVNGTEIVNIDNQRLTL